MSTCRLLTGILVLTTCLVPPLARANTFYTYTGHTFNEFDGTDSCPPECSVSGFFEVATPLAPSATFSTGFSTLSVIDFGFTDGNLVWGENNTTSASFTVTTDSAGHFVLWDIQLQEAGVSIETHVGVGTGDGAIDFTDYSNGSARFQGVGNGAGVVGMPGTWSICTDTVRVCSTGGFTTGTGGNNGGGTGVPEPSSLILIVGGSLLVLSRGRQFQ